MSSDPKDQKTAILQEAPPEVQKLAGGSSTPAKPGGMASSLPPPAAPPPPSQAPAGAPVSSQKTVMMDVAAPSAPARQAVVPTMMKERPSGSLPPVRRPRREAAWGRWIAGPLLAGAIAVGTAALAGAVMPAKPKTPPQKPQGRLRINSVPAGAAVTVDGKLFPHFTPTVVSGDVGATLHLGFKLDGYAAKAVDVYIADGEHPFALKLDALPAPPPAPVVVAPPPAPKKEHHHAEKKVAAGTGTISIFVRPWAIVYVDGSRLRQTPVENFALPSGKHTIELVNEIKKRREKVPLTLKPGETEEIRRDWDQ